MRLYSFVNYYLSPLQHGLQTAHCVSDMAAMVASISADNPASRNFAIREAYDAWARSHKTIIICNGGNQAMLEDLFLRLVEFSVQFSLPLVKFYEDEQSLNNALTSVAIIVPEKFYDVKFNPADETGPAYYSYVVDGMVISNYESGTPEFEFISLLKSFRLA